MRLNESFELNIVSISNLVSLFRNGYDNFCCKYRRGRQCKYDVTKQLSWMICIFIYTHIHNLRHTYIFQKKNVSKFNVSSINRTIIQVQYIYFPFTCLNRATGRSVILLMLKLCLKINYGYLLSTSINMPSVQRVNLHKLRWTSGPGLYWSRRHTVRRKFI